MILESLKLTSEEFVDLCILCGCDYTIKINKIGYVTSYKLIKKFKNIEEIIKNIKSNEKYFITDDFLKNFKYQESRNIFLKTDYDLPEINLKNDKIDTDKFKEFLLRNKINYSI